ncbi:MAG: long-chain-acyl-CoA synthetase [Betaproteobacteria bacterium]|nr:long-chain-acyl-CoA synthetase [Betaproteobacteria bacterium]
MDARAAVTARIKPGAEYTIADRLEERALTYSTRPFLYYGDITLSYAEVNARSNRLAHTLHVLGLRAGQVCALAMENRPDLFVIWFALSKLGVTAALLNTQIHGQPLQHALVEARTDAVIVGEECLASFADQEARLPLWLWPDPERPAAPELRALSALELRPLTAAATTENPSRAWRAGVLAGDTAVLVFTSGTTGMPKAAKYSHLRWLMVGDVMEVTLHTTCADVFYCFLPLYHGAAAVSLGSTALQCGSAIAIRRRFSAREFWKDVRRYGVTTMQYVGEICRYVLHQPANSDDRQHTLRRMTGTGMSAELWQRWVERFGAMDIFESWGATESNCNLINVDNHPGSCGRVPYWEKTNLRLIRYDAGSDRYPRDKEGRYVLCEPGEIGEAIGMVIDSPETGAGRFEGYTSTAATEQKILRNVFRDGDAWWRSGDLIRHDMDGYCWFVDRIGDTFRWKSENVSTMEVADALVGFPGLAFVTIYGVAVPEQEGRCGMAALVLHPGKTFDAEGFFKRTEESLPHYAVPQFVRLCAQVDMTTTYKLRKVDLQAQGYDSARCGDPVYVRDDEGRTYVPLSKEALERAGFAPFA